MRDLASRRAVLRALAAAGALTFTPVKAANALDERVLAFTAGDDYALDERLVKYDVRASLAHAAMLNTAGLLSDADLAAIRDGLNAIAQEHAQRAWDERTPLRSLLEAADLGLDLDAVFDLAHYTRHAAEIVGRLD